MVSLNTKLALLAVRHLKQEVIGLLLDHLALDSNIMACFVHDHEFGIYHDFHCDRDVNELRSEIEVFMVGFYVRVYFLYGVNLDLACFSFRAGFRLEILEFLSTLVPSEQILLRLLSLVFYHVLRGRLRNIEFLDDR